MTRHRAEGFRCKAVRTTQSYICGAFLYEKALPSLTSTSLLQLLESDCRRMSYNGVFQDPETGHKEQDIKGVGMFHFSASVSGVKYISGGDTACQGVSVVINGEMINRLVQTTKYEVTVTTEQLELSTSSVTALSTGEQLQCSDTSRGCTGARYVYSCHHGLPIASDSGSYRKLDPHY